MGGFSTPSKPGGIEKLSELIIDVHKDWGTYRIVNVGTPTAPTHVVVTEAGNVIPLPQIPSPLTGKVVDTLADGAVSTTAKIAAAIKDVAEGLPVLDASAHIKSAQIPVITDTQHGLRGSGLHKVEPWQRWEFFDHMTRDIQIYPTRLAVGSDVDHGGGSYLDLAVENVAGRYTEVGISSRLDVGADLLEDLRLAYEWEFACRINWYDTPLTGNNWTIRFGVGVPAAVGADLSHGTYFEQVRGVGVGNLIAVVNNLGARTTVDLGINPWLLLHRYRIVPSPTTTLFYVDDMVTPKATVDAAMPTDESQMIFFQIITNANQPLHASIDWIHAIGKGF